METKAKLTWFLCGCCGNDFRDTLANQLPHDQDEGYGICDSCNSWIEKKNEKEWDKAEKLVADNLNEVNRQKFLGYEKEVRRGIILKLIENKVITFSIGKG